MAGIFGLFDYTKEGPGVEADEPQKGPLAEFFTLYFRKFWKFVTLGLMFTLFNLPGIVLALIASLYLLPLLFPGLALNRLIESVESLNLEFVEGVTAATVGALYSIIFVAILALTLVALQYFVVGPSHAALTYIHRNYARGEHAFLWWDFKDAFKANWKQSLITSILGALFCAMIIFAYNFYGQVAVGLLGVVVRTLLMLILVLITIAQMYIYQMMVTFELPLKYLFKNAFLFTILRLPFNLGILLALLVVNTVIPLVVMLFLPDVRALFIIAAYFIFFASSFSLFLINYFVNRQLQRFMIQPLMAQEAAEEAALAEDWEYDEDEFDDEVPADEEVDEEDEEDEGSESRRVPRHAPV